MNIRNLRENWIISNGILIVMLTILIVQSVNPNSITADRDASRMGIENGDQFSFIMESLIVTAGYGFNPPFLESDFFAGDNINIGTGDEFTMTIVNATPQVIDEGTQY